MKKLREEDYKSPPIPTSYWVNRGFDEAYVKDMESFLHEIKRVTLQLLSGERLQCGESIYLRRAYGEKEQVSLQHDDIMIPHLEEFIDALRQYSHEPERYSERLLCIHNVTLHPSVMDMLAPVIQTKGYTIELQNER